MYHGTIEFVLRDKSKIMCWILWSHIIPLCKEWPSNVRNFEEILEFFCISCTPMYLSRKALWGVSILNNRVCSIMAFRLTWVKRQESSWWFCWNVKSTRDIAFEQLSLGMETNYYYYYWTATDLVNGDENIWKKHLIFWSCLAKMIVVLNTDTSHTDCCDIQPR